MPSNAHLAQRGVALLIVLAALVITSSACAVLARLAWSTRAAGDADRCTRVADDLLLALDAPISRWLAEQARGIVLDSDVTEPAVPVLHDCWRCGDDSIEVRITAWDQCGMAPLSQLHRGSPLRLALPDSILEVVDRIGAADVQSPGLDVLADRVQSEMEWRDTAVFPVAPMASPQVFGDQAVSRDSRADPVQIRPALGALIATHNPPLTRGSARRRSFLAAGGMINVNTALAPLLEAAMRATGHAGLTHTLNSRDKGRPSDIIGLPVGSDAHRLQLVTASTCWSFRIDIRVNRIHRSWWTVHVFESGSWQAAQRLVITE